VPPPREGRSSPGRVLSVGRGDHRYESFVPDPLPPAIEWTSGVVTLLSAADRALGQLSGLGRNLPNPHLLIGLFTRREAVLSSRIEGTQALLSDLVLFEAAPENEPRIPDVREVANYVRALEHGLAVQTTLPMSLRLIRQMHALLMEGVRGQERDPGQFRRTQNWIGPPGSTIATATFVPPPPDELPGTLGAFEQYLHARSDLPPIVRLALIHYQFEAIHPFLDGNGRIGRLLITLLLCMERVLPGPLLYLSAYFERHRQAYYDGLLGVSRAGMWTEWIEFFLRGVSEQAMDAVERAARLLAMQGDFRRLLSAPRASVLQLRLVDLLFTSPALTASRVAKTLGVTARSAQLNIDKLVAVGILREVTGRKRGRVYLAESILRAIE
jgi:Fic family protein